VRRSADRTGEPSRTEAPASAAASSPASTATSSTSIPSSSSVWTRDATGRWVQPQVRRPLSTSVAISPSLVRQSPQLTAYTTPPTTSSAPPAALLSLPLAQSFYHQPQQRNPSQDDLPTFRALLSDHVTACTACTSLCRSLFRRSPANSQFVFVQWALLSVSSARSALALMDNDGARAYVGADLHKVALAAAEATVTFAACVLDLLSAREEARWQTRRGATTRDSRALCDDEIAVGEALAALKVRLASVTPARCADERVAGAHATTSSTAVSSSPIRRLPLHSFALIASHLTDPADVTNWLEVARGIETGRQRQTGAGQRAEDAQSVDTGCAHRGQERLCRRCVGARVSSCPLRPFDWLWRRCALSLIAKRQRIRARDRVHRHGLSVPPPSLVRFPDNSVRVSGPPVALVCTACGALKLHRGVRLLARSIINYATRLAEAADPGSSLTSLVLPSALFHPLFSSSTIHRRHESRGQTTQCSVGDASAGVWEQVGGLGVSHWRSTVRRLVSLSLPPSHGLVHCATCNRLAFLSHLTLPGTLSLPHIHKNPQSLTLAQLAECPASASSAPCILTPVDVHSDFTTFLLKGAWKNL